MSWFKRKTKGIQTATEEKKDIPQGLWYKSPTGKIVETEELAQNCYISPEDGYHVRIGSKDSFRWEVQRVGQDHEVQGSFGF